MFSVVRSGFTPPPFKSKGCFYIMCRQKEARGKQVATLEGIWKGLDSYQENDRLFACTGDLAYAVPTLVAIWLFPMGQPMIKVVMPKKLDHVYNTLALFRGLIMWPSSIHS